MLKNHESLFALYPSLYCLVLSLDNSACLPVSYFPLWSESSTTLNSPKLFQYVCTGPSGIPRVHSVTGECLSISLHIVLKSQHTSRRFLQSALLRCGVQLCAASSDSSALRGWISHCFPCLCAAQ